MGMDQVERQFIEQNQGGSAFKCITPFSLRRRTVSGEGDTECIANGNPNLLVCGATGERGNNVRLGWSQRGVEWQAARFRFPGVSGSLKFQATSHYQYTFGDAWQKLAL